MNLVVDIGNTSLKYSSTTDIGIKKVRQLKYSKKKPTFIIKFLKNQFKTHKIIYICSVVPEIDKIIKENLKTYRKDLIFINKKKLTSLVHRRVNLSQLGNDRIINVLSAIKIYPKSKSFIIIDLGTATTLDLSLIHI